MMNFFGTPFAGLNLPNPIIIASSGLTGTPEKNRELEKAGAGAVILQSIFEDEIETQTNTPTQVLSPDTCIAAPTREKRMRITDYLSLIRETKKQCRIPVIASIICHHAGNWINFVKQIETAGADAIELNIFALCPGNKGSHNSIEQLYINITRSVKALVAIPIIVKISKYFSHIVQLARDLQTAGATGVALFSRFYQPDIDIHRMQIRSGDVFSSATDIADTLRWTPIVSGKLPDLSIASCTGIHDWEGIIKCILSGASAVEICSSVYLHGNEIISVMRQGIEEWMTSMNFRSIKEFQGKLNRVYVEDPSLYERTQFRKYFSDRDTE